VHKSSAVVLGGKEYSADRAKLKRWLQLEDIREKIARATDREDRSGFTALLYSYLSVALSVEDDFSQLPWHEVATAYDDLLKLNNLSLDLPLLHSAGDDEKVSWDYEGRTWYSWASVFSKSFGWSLEYVAELDIDDAVALLQEIRSAEQLNREWEWMLTEISYDKRGKHKSLPRPPWMKGIIIPNVDPKTKIRKDYLPMGNVVRWDSDGHTDD
jgi:hypothetical protein